MNKTLRKSDISKMQFQLQLLPVGGNNKYINACMTVLLHEHIYFWQCPSTSAEQVLENRKSASMIWYRRRRANSLNRNQFTLVCRGACHNDYGTMADEKSKFQFKEQN